MSPCESRVVLRSYLECDLLRSLGGPSEVRKKCFVSLTASGFSAGLVRVVIRNEILLFVEEELAEIFLSVSLAFEQR